MIICISCSYYLVVGEEGAVAPGNHGGAGDSQPQAISSILYPRLGAQIIYRF